MQNTFPLIPNFQLPWRRWPPNHDPIPDYESTWVSTCWFCLPQGLCPYGKSLSRLIARSVFEFCPEEPLWGRCRMASSTAQPYYKAPIMFTVYCLLFNAFYTYPKVFHPGNPCHSVRPPFLFCLVEVIWLLLFFFDVIYPRVKCNLMKLIKFRIFYISIVKIFLKILKFQSKF